MWKMLHRSIKFLMTACNVIAASCMVYAVVKRYLFRGNFYGSDEVIMLFAFWLYFLGAAYGSFEDSHIKADLLSVYLKRDRVKDAMSLVAQTLTVVVNTIVLVWAARYFSLEVKRWGLSTSLKIPLVIPKSSIFFGFLLMEFYHVVYLVGGFRRFLRGERVIKPAQDAPSGGGEPSIGEPAEALP